jgi:hypothetical protein
VPVYGRSAVALDDPVSRECRDAVGKLVRTGKARQRDLDGFPGFALKWDKFNALEITRGCICACA